MSNHANTIESDTLFQTETVTESGIEMLNPDQENVSLIVTPSGSVQYYERGHGQTHFKMKETFNDGESFTEWWLG